MGFTRPGKRLHNELEHHHAINGKIHDFDWAIFNSYVSLPEGTPHFDSAKFQLWLLKSSLLFLDQTH